MLQIHCSGSPFEMGLRHGDLAKELIIGSIKFYSAYFQSKSHLDWHATTTAAEGFLPFLSRHCPHLVEEIRGIATGASLPFCDILALNVRTEISMGLALPSDGCTSLFYKSIEPNEGGVLAQNWDWETAQGANLIALHLEPASRPAISMITEAGIIGKIGFNSTGVGVCLNAIRARGVDFNRLPVHIALRSALECNSAEEAVKGLTETGAAASCHILVADAKEAMGLELSHCDTVQLPVRNGKFSHTNHWLVPHTGPDGPIKENIFLHDSQHRLNRLNSLLEQLGTKATTVEAIGTISSILEDEDNYPASINKAVSKQASVATLFSIVMDLRNKAAIVRVGRPTEPLERLALQLN